MKVTTYAYEISVSRAELDEARRTAYPMMGVKYLSVLDTRFRLAEQLERQMVADIEAHQKAVDEYPAKLAAWQDARKKQVDAIEARITAGAKFTHEEISRMVDEIWSTKPADPNKELIRRMGLAK